MSSYLPKKKLTRGAHGNYKPFHAHFENAQAKLKEVIQNIEDTSDDSTILSLDTYADNGVPVELVSKMLRSIRMDLLDADREFVKAAEALNA